MIPTGNLTGPRRRTESRPNRKNPHTTYSSGTRLFIDLGVATDEFSNGALAELRIKRMKGYR